MRSRNDLDRRIGGQVAGRPISVVRSAHQQMKQICRRAKRLQVALFRYRFCSKPELIERSALFFRINAGDKTTLRRQKLRQKRRQESAKCRQPILSGNFIFLRLHPIRFSNRYIFGGSRLMNQSFIFARIVSADVCRIRQMY